MHEPGQGLQSGSEQQFGQVLIGMGSDAFLAVVVSLGTRDVVGRYPLDLGAEYGLA